MEAPSSGKGEREHLPMADHLLKCFRFAGQIAFCRCLSACSEHGAGNRRVILTSVLATRWIKIERWPHALDQAFNLLALAQAVALITRNSSHISGGKNQQSENRNSRICVTSKIPVPGKQFYIKWKIRNQFKMKRGGGIISVACTVSIS